MAARTAFLMTQLARLLPPEIIRVREEVGRMLSARGLTLIDADTVTHREGLPSEDLGPWTLTIDF